MSRCPLAAPLISRRKRRLLSVITAIVAAVLAITSLSSCTPQPTLAQVKQATAGYTNLAVAEAHGYQLRLNPAGGQCVEDARRGAQGEHYVALGRYRDLREDALAREGLLYDVLSDGKRKLVGVEYLVPKAQRDRLNRQPPTVLGHRLTLSGSLGIGLPAFYSLHVWLYLPNPSGVFSDWNPHLACRE